LIGKLGQDIEGLVENDDTGHALKIPTSGRKGKAVPGE
jgi:hypothetical protein